MNCDICRSLKTNLIKSYLRFWAFDVCACTHSKWKRNVWLIVSVIGLIARSKEHTYKLRHAMAYIIYGFQKYRSYSHNVRLCVCVCARSFYFIKVVRRSCVLWFVEAFIITMKVRWCIILLFRFISDIFIVIAKSTSISFLVKWAVNAKFNQNQTNENRSG